MAGPAPIAKQNAQQIAYTPGMRRGLHLLDKTPRRMDVVRRLAMALACLAIVCAPAAGADERPTYQSLMDQVTASGDCTPQDDVDIVIFTCAKSEDLWYFTKQGHPAHPGVVRRYVVQSDQGMSIAEHGWSFAADAAQPAFKTFLAQISALDEQMKEAMAEQHGGPPILDPALRIYGNWQPQGTQSEAVVSLTRRYFALVDSGRYQDAYDLIDGSLAAMVPFAAYVDQAKAVVAGIGPVTSRTVKTIDWEKDSPLGPPGIYAALDYSGSGQNGQICGYVAWRMEPDGFFTLVREETNIIPATASATDAAALKAKFHCVD